MLLHHLDAPRLTDFFISTCFQTDCQGPREWYRSPSEECVETWSRMPFDGTFPRSSEKRINICNKCMRKLHLRYFINVAVRGLVLIEQSPKLVKVSAYKAETIRGRV